MVQKISQVIRRDHPQIMLISGAPSPTVDLTLDGEIVAIENLAYLASMLNAGLLDQVDCVGIQHQGFNLPPSVRWDELPETSDAVFSTPYTNPHPSWSFRSTLELSAELVRDVDRFMPLCVTSFGWATHDLDGSVPPGYEFALDVSAAQQSEWSFQALEMMLGWGFVKLAILSNLNAAQINSNDPYTLYSMLDLNGNLQPIYNAFVERFGSDAFVVSDFPVPASYFVDDDPYLGPENAPVVIVEFSDYLCGFCRRHTALTKPRILEEYGDLVRYVYRDFPTVGGQDAIQAALAAECAHDQGHFWAYHDLLFDDVAAISGSGAETELRNYAMELGLDMQQFQACYDDRIHLQEIVHDSNDAQRNGARGTPFFLINGQPFIGAQPFSEFAALIDAELDRLGVAH
jgi:protein-disulfide isomerase